MYYSLHFKAPMWNVKKGLKHTHLSDSFDEFKSFLPSLTLCGRPVVPPDQYNVTDMGVELVCKYLKLYKNRTLDNYLFKGTCTGYSSNQMKKTQYCGETFKIFTVLN